MRIRLIEVFDLTNSRYNEQNCPVHWHFVKSGFHCIRFYVVERVPWLSNPGRSCSLKRYGGCTCQHDLPCSLRRGGKNNEVCLGVGRWQKGLLYAWLSWWIFLMLPVFKDIKMVYIKERQNKFFALANQFRRTNINKIKCVRASPLYALLFGANFSCRPVAMMSNM